jgi:hypothetical protein
MRHYTTRPVRAGGYLAALLLLTLLYLVLMLPAFAAIMATLMALAPTGEGLSLKLFPPVLALVASGTYPVVALIAIVAGWTRYAQRRYPQAVGVALLPLLNLALFGLAVLLVSLLERPPWR